MILVRVDQGRSTNIVTEKKPDHCHPKRSERSEESIAMERGGGYYHMKKFQTRQVNKDLWLCDVTRFVFGDLPKKIFIKRIQ